MSGIIAAAGITAAAGVYGANQARRAGRDQANAAREGRNVQREMFDKQNELNEPFRQAGITGQNRYMELMGLGGNTNALGYGKYARDFGMSDFEKDPGYEFRLAEGLKALDRRNSAAGMGFRGGSAYKGAARYGQDYASNEYGRAFDRYQINRSNQLNPLAALAGMGQTATGAMSRDAGDFGARSAASAMDIGNAQGAARMNAANALAGGVGQGLNYYQNSRLMDIYSRRGGVKPPGYGDIVPGGDFDMMG